MEKRKTVKPVRRELRVILKLIPLVLVSLLLAAVLWQPNAAAISGLFQAGQSPLPTPTSLPPTLVPTEEPTQVPTEVPTVAPTETLTPTATIAPTETPTQPAPTAEEPTLTPLASPTTAPLTTATDPGRYAGEDTSLKFEWGMLFDSVALGVSYAWLCCGILLLLSIPIVFVILWVMSKRRQQQDE